MATGSGQVRLVKRRNGLFNVGLKCDLCGRTDESLDMHHVYEGSRRQLSEKYGAVVFLCHNRCHIFGENAVHKCRETDLHFKRLTQQRLMEKNGWDIEQFTDIFGKNYL